MRNAPKTTVKQSNSTACPCGPNCRCGEACRCTKGASAPNCRCSS